jgi:hypothetical protein
MRSRRTLVVVAAVVFGMLLAAVILALQETGAERAAVAAPGDGPATARAALDGGAECAGASSSVSTPKQLKAALKEAGPGDVIVLAPGTYEGRFTLTGDGTRERPITLCGPRDAIIDGGGIEKGYAVHLDDASWWVVSGFSVRNSQKGVIADATSHTLIENLSISKTGDEAVHLRAFSTDNRVSGNTIRDTGNRKPKFGEGVYVGTAESNWCDVSDCEPDASDRNLVDGNDIAGTTAESVDLKEGTTGGVLRGNTFDGSALSGADSWVDVKGNDWIIEDNAGTASPKDGYQVHNILDGWGTGNVFRSNTADVDGSGVGYSITPELDNVVECSNKASGAKKGTTNVDCTRD